MVEKSVFLTKFDEPADVQSIEQSLSKFGQLNRIILDQQNRSYAIVEFKEAEAAQNLLRNFSKLQIGAVIFIDTKKC